MTHPHTAFCKYSWLSRPITYISQLINTTITSGINWLLTMSRLPPAPPCRGMLVSRVQDGKDQCAVKGVWSRNSCESSMFREIRSPDGEMKAVKWLPWPGVVHMTALMAAGVLLYFLFPLVFFYFLNDRYFYIAFFFLIILLKYFSVDFFFLSLSLLHSSRHEHLIPILRTLV